MEEQEMTVGEKIAKLRKSKNMTQADLGAELNISYQAVSKWERDESSPDFDMMSRLAKTFGVSIAYFEKGGEKLEENKSVAPAPAPAPAPVKEEPPKAPEPKREMIGVCRICGKSVYTNEGKVTSYSEKTTERVRSGKGYIDREKKIEKSGLLCNACIRKVEEERKKEAEAKRLKEIAEKEARVAARNKGLLLGALIALGVLALLFIFKNAILSGISKGAHKDISSGAYIGIVCALTVLTYLFAAQLFWDGFIPDCFETIASKSIQFPGIIFSWDLDGFKFLILMKLLFAVLGFLVGVAVFLLAVVVCLVLAPFTFVPALLRVNREGVDD